MTNLTSTKIGTFIYYIINTFSDGVHRIASSPPKAFLYFVLTLLAPVLQIISVPPNLLLALLPLYAFIDVLLTVMLVFPFSDLHRLSTLYNFSTINFCNSAGACPWLVSRSISDGVITYIFHCRGISLDLWRERQKGL